MEKYKAMAVLFAVFLSASILASCSSGFDTSFDNERDITVVSREEGSGTRGAFIELMGIEEQHPDGTKIDRTTKEAIIVSKTDVMLTNIAGDKYAIGYVSMGSLNESVKALKVDGIYPSAENVKNGSYKIARPFIVATKGEPKGLAKDFLDFILSAEGQAVVAESYIKINDSAPAYNGAKPEGKIVVAGSSSVTPVMEKLKEAYCAINPGAEIEIQMSDSTSGMTGAMEGTCDIGMASRKLKESEAARLTSTEIALDGIAIIVNPENPMSDISSKVVKAVFAGEAVTWSQVME